MTEKLKLIPVFVKESTLKKLEMKGNLERCGFETPYLETIYHSLIFIFKDSADIPVSHWFLMLCWSCEN